MAAHPPLLQPLESRLLLSGNVTVSVVGMSLYITGDDLSNDIVVTRTAPSTYQVASGVSGTTINFAAGPTTFAGVTADIQATLNGGDDRVEFSGPGVLAGSLSISTGAGNNIVYIHNLFGISGNLFVNGGAGEDDVLMAGAIVNGSITVLSGAGASDVEMGGTTVKGGVTVFASGGGTLTGNWAGYSKVFLVSNNSSVDGPINVFNGPGPNTVGLNDSTIHSVLISNGSGGAYAGLSNTTLTGTFTFLRGDGGSLPAPLAAYASQVNMANHTTVTGGITIINGSGVDSSTFTTCTLGGSVLISNGAGPSRMQLDGTSVAGGVTLMTSGGGVLPSTITLATYTIFANSCEIGGNLNLFMGAGNDEQDFNGLTVHGNVLISNGPDAAAVLGLNSHFQQSFTWLRGDGGSLVGAFVNFASDFEMTGSTFGSVTVIDGSGNDGAVFGGCTLGGLFMSNGAGASVLAMYGATVNGNVTHLATGGGFIDSPPYVDYATATVFDNTSHVTGDITVLAGAGNDNLDIENTNVDGSVFLSAGVGGTLLTTTAEIIKGRVTVLRGDGGSLAAVPGYASYANMTNTVVGGDMTFLNGAGNDGIAMTNVAGAGGLLVLDGADAASINASNAVIHNGLTMIRGDGGNLLFAPGCASWMQFAGGTTFIGPVFIMNGAGKDLVNFDQAEVDSSVTIMSGTGDQTVGVTHALIASSLSIYGTGGAAQIFLGSSASDFAVIQGSLTISTGDSNDTVTLLDVGVAGTTSINTAGGDDTVTIDDSGFTGTVDITTGPAYIASGTDNDTVNIERLDSTADISMFNQLLRINGGAGNDAVNIGVFKGTNAHARFVKGFQFDGGPGTNTITYVWNDNVFDAGAVQAVVNATVS